jgi:hypothetical protein
MAEWLKPALTPNAITVYGPCACSPIGKQLQVSLPHAPNPTTLYTM